MSKFSNMYSKLGDFARNNYYNPNGKRGALIHPFRLLEVGCSGSGKSNATLCVINNCSCFTKIYLVSANGNDEPLYKFLKHMLGDSLKIIEDVKDLPALPSATKSSKKMKEEKHSTQMLGKRVNRHPKDEMEEETEADSSESNSDEEEEPVNMYGKICPKQKLIIFEDQVFEGRERLEIVKSYFSRGRNAGFSVILTSQSWYSIPKAIRLNANYVMLFKQCNMKDIRLTLSEFPGINMTLEQFVKAYQIATDKPMNFMLIDMVTHDPNLRVRHNFAEAIQPVS